MPPMFHQRELIRIGKLDVLEIRGRGEGLCVILFHGYGADCFDLASLSDVASIPQGLHWIFPQGSLEVPIGPAWTGRAWFPIDVERLEEARRMGRTMELVQQRPQGLHQARERALEMIEKLPFPKSRIVVGGFSQGAMLATELALSASDSFAGLVILSGTWLDDERWSSLAGKKPGFPFFQSHGIYDTVLPIEPAQILNERLEKAQWNGHLYEFKGGHEIPLPVIGQLGSFLRERAKKIP